MNSDVTQHSDFDQTKGSCQRKCGLGLISYPILIFIFKLIQTVWKRALQGAQQ